MSKTGLMALQSEQSDGGFSLIANEEISVGNYTPKDEEMQCTSSEDEKDVIPQLGQPGSSSTKPAGSDPPPPDEFGKPEDKKMNYGEYAGKMFSEIYAADPEYSDRLAKTYGNKKQPLYVQTYCLVRKFLSMAQFSGGTSKEATDAQEEARYA